MFFTKAQFLQAVESEVAERIADEMADAEAKFTKKVEREESKLEAIQEGLRLERRAFEELKEDWENDKDREYREKESKLNIKIESLEAQVKVKNDEIESLHKRLEKGIVVNMADIKGLAVAMSSSKTDLSVEKKALLLGTADKNTDGNKDGKTREAMQAGHEYPYPMDEDGSVIDPLYRAYR